MKKSEIKIIVSLDDENIPEKIEWDAEDSMSQGLSETKSISLSLWDEKKNNTLRIDLWTKEMKTDEMKKIVKLIDMVINDPDNDDCIQKVKSQVEELCESFPIYEGISH